MSHSSFKKTSLLYAVLACSLALNVVLVLNRRQPEQTQGASAAGTGDPGSTVGDASPPGAAATGEAALDAARQLGSREPLAAEQIPGQAPAAGWTVVSGEVEHSLARTLQREAGEAGDALTSVFTRLFVWDVDVRRDLHAGDTISVAWREGSDGLPEIAAASLHLSKLGRTVTTYRWQVPGDPFPSYWHLDGTEVPLRLKGGPIERYEQITSLLKDRPTHKGMDFKTPVGTEVTSPRAGRVTRANWNWKANGNCIEIRYDDGVIAKFLHLNENRVKPGDRVHVGQVIALSGNTGHSTAPHLHYQLDRGSKTIDPLEYHGTVRRSLEADQVVALRRAVAGFEKMLAEAVEG